MKKWMVPALLLAVALGQVVRIRAVAEDVAEDVPRAAPRKVVEAIDDEYPEYRVEPPDVLLVRLLSGDPKEDIKLRPGDLLVVTFEEMTTKKQVILRRGKRDGVKIGTAISVVEIVAEVGDDGEFRQPVGERICDPFPAAGLTLDQCAAKIRDGLAPKYSLGLPRLTLKLMDVPSIDGKHLIGPGGNLNLGEYGQVYVARKTVEEVRQTVEEQLAEHFNEPKVLVNVFAYNSQPYYIITQGAGKGDTVQRCPLHPQKRTTVQDAIRSAMFSHPMKFSEAKIWIARPAPDVLGSDRILPVDWKAISQGGDTATNYQMLPGDRLFMQQPDSFKVGGTYPRPAPPMPYPERQINRLPDGAFSNASQVFEQVLFQYTMIKDTSGVLADNKSFKGSPSVCDAAEVTELIESLRVDDRIKVLSQPKLLTVFDRPARLVVGQEAVVGATQKPNGTELEVVARKKRLAEGPDEVLLDVHASVTSKGRTFEFESGFVHEPGKANVLRLTPAPNEDNGDGVGAVYAVLTAEVVTGGMLPELQPQVIERPTKVRRR